MIVDASVLARVVMPSQFDPKVAAVLARPGLRAPPNLRIEIGHVLTKKLRARQISRAQLETIWRDIDGLPIRIMPPPSWALAMSLCVDLNIVFNDACYLAAAVQHEDLLVTADDRLVAAARSRSDTSPRVLSIAEL